MPAVGRRTRRREPDRRRAWTSADAARPRVVFHVTRAREACAVFSCRARGLTIHLDRRRHRFLWYVLCRASTPRAPMGPLRRAIRGRAASSVSSPRVGLSDVAAQAARHTDARRPRDPTGANKPCILHASCVRTFHVTPGSDTWPPAASWGECAHLLGPLCTLVQPPY